MRGRATDFPLLPGLGLYAANIRGDGNCLFSALSDQIYGSPNQGHEIRSAVIAHMRENAGHYKAFLDVQPGGGQRRNPKRKNAGSFSTVVNHQAPSAEETDRVFESYLRNMEKGGTYGDNIEIVAFSAAFKTDVKIYQKDTAYMVNSSAATNDGEVRPMAHIAYHVWEHYSSIRNISGPHTGPPMIHNEKIQNGNLSKVLPAQPLMINAGMNAEEAGNLSSNTGSSSVEREPDSDDEAGSGPNKKQNRSLTRAIKSIRKNKDGQRNRHLTTRKDAQETDNSLSSTPGSSSSNVEPKSDDHDQAGSVPQKKPFRRLIRGTRAAFKDKEAQREQDPTTSTAKDKSRLIHKILPEIRSSDKPKLSEHNAKTGHGDTTKDKDWRPKLVQSDSSASDNSSESRNSAPASRISSSYSLTKEQLTTLKVSRSEHKESGPQKPRVSARDRKDQRKAAQKAAAKERKKSNGDTKVVNGVAGKNDSRMAVGTGKANGSGFPMSMRLVII